MILGHEETSAFVCFVHHKDLRYNPKQCKLFLYSLQQSLPRGFNDIMYICVHVSIMMQQYFQKHT